jgi:hypothetical protein
MRIIGKTADDLARRGRATVLGVFGGSLFATLAYTVSTIFPVLNTKLFFVLMTMTGISGGVAIIRLLVGSKTFTSDTENLFFLNNALFNELMERAQSPGLTATQKKILTDQAVTLSLQLGLAAPPPPPVPRPPAPPPLQIGGPQLEDEK